MSPEFLLDSVPPPLREPVARWWERAGALPELLDALGALPPALRAEMPRVVAASEFVAAALLRDPGALGWLATRDTDYAQRVAAAPTPGDAQRLLRQWRRREMLRIAWQDIAARAAVTETLRAVSDLADACIRAACAAAQRHLVATFGMPRDAEGEAVPLIVVAMGKLGGRELNFSSDIDLVLLYARAGETDGGRGDDAPRDDAPSDGGLAGDVRRSDARRDAARRIDNAEYFDRLGRDVIRLLDARTEDGFVFRVDMRLRPFGDSGGLVVSLASLENYLQEHGRDWERYAWIKARAVVGGAAYATAWQDFVRPFVYRRYLDFGVFESLREMKALIAKEVARHALDHHLKLGAGGIRELEFIVQSLQLVRGGTDSRLQHATLLDVLPLLAGSKVLPVTAVAELRECYRVLRKAENAVQMLRDEQTHVLPEDASDRLRVALNMGLPDWPAALAKVDAARHVVARQFGTLVFGVPTDKEGEALGFPDAEADAVTSGAGASGAAASDAAAPLADTAAVTALLEAYRQAAAYRRLDEGARRRVHVILGRLLKAAALRPAPATVVDRVLRILEAIGARSSYLALLKEQPAALERLIDVCAVSGFLARQVADFPLLLDELIDPNAFDEPPSRASFVRELAARTERLPADDPERQVEALRQFQKVAVFCVAFADLTGRLPLMRVSDRLTDIAELIIQRCVALAREQMTQVYGPREVKVAVAAYGKLGGLELGYGSDLDLVFLHDSGAEADSVFLLRLAQRIVHLLTMHSAAGRLYEVDMRLRPNGKGGFLITGIDAFERYQRQDAWTWEHQALLRARAVAGDAALCRRFEAARRDTLRVAVHRDTLRADVAGMRTRMRRELSRAAAGQFDIKQDAGGMADIEFLVQYWVLASAGEHPELLAHSDNIRQLGGLAAAGVVSPDTAVLLSGAYVEYRTVLHHLSLEGGERVVESAPYAHMRDSVTTVWKETFEGGALSSPWVGPYGGIPPLDRVRVADFVPALEAAMAEKLAEIDRIASDAAPPTFDNTLVALERAGRAFERVNTLYEIWSSSMNTGEFQAVERAMGPRIAAFHDAITQNARLFARIEAVYRQSIAGAEGSAVQKRLCWLHYTRFVRAGAKLDSAAKARVGEINERLAALFASFGQNLLADEAGHPLFLRERADLAGLPESQCEAAAAAAAALGRPGEWAILNTRSAMDPFLTHAVRRDLREQVWRTYYNRGNNGDAHDNKALVTEILALRAERAKLLGYSTHAHWRLADSMAGSPEAALALLERVWPAAVARVREEVADMQALADPGVVIAAWDYRFYAEKVRKREIRSRHERGEAVPAAREAARGHVLGGIEAVWVHVRADPGTARARSGRAGMGGPFGRGRPRGLVVFRSLCAGGQELGGVDERVPRPEQNLDRESPIVSNNTNFLRAARRRSAAHQLGRCGDACSTSSAMRCTGLNSDVEFPALVRHARGAGLRGVPVAAARELAGHPGAVVALRAARRDGRPMPDALIAKIKAARTFNQGFATVEYLAAALVDMRLHLTTEPVPDAGSLRARHARFARHARRGGDAASHAAVRAHVRERFVLGRLLQLSLGRGARP